MVGSVDSSVSVVNERDGEREGDMSKGCGMLDFFDVSGVMLEPGPPCWEPGEENELDRSLEFNTEENSCSDQLARSLSSSWCNERRGGRRAVLEGGKDKGGGEVFLSC